MKSSIKCKPAKRKPIAAKNGGRFLRWLNSPKVKPWILGVLVLVQTVILTSIFSGIIFLTLSVSANNGLELADGFATSAIVHVVWTGTNMMLIPFGASMAGALSIILLFPVFFIIFSCGGDEISFPLSVILSIPIGIAAFIVLGPVISIF